MEKHGATKEAIIKLISKGDNNLSVICKRLGLAPSTVSKHLHDLEENGIITQRETHFRKWKYYDIAPHINSERVRERGITLSRGLIVSAVAAIALLAAVIYLNNYGTNTSPGTSYIPVSITDPPQVPQGTQALYMNYSSLSVYVTYKNSSEWLDLNSSGRLDLLSLVNKSQIIGLANIKPNSTVTRIMFNISSAKITINNETYDVYVPNNHVDAYVENNGMVNASSDILVDFSPVVAELYTQNATMFVLVPALKAIVSNNMGTVTRGTVGVGIHMISSLPEQGVGMFSAQSLNATIENPVLSVSNGNASFSAKIKNTGPGNFTIIGIDVGNGTIMNKGIAINTGGLPTVQSTDQGVVVSQRIIESPVLNSAAYPIADGTHFIINMNIGNESFYKQNNSSVLINASALMSRLAYGTNTITIHLNGSVNTIVVSSPTEPITTGFYAFGGTGPGLNFIVNSNGTLTTPFDSKQIFMQQSSGTMRIDSIRHFDIGYTVLPGSTATLSYNGTINASHIRITPGNTYVLVVETNEGVVQANVTAK